MNSKHINLPAWVVANAWREIFARVFAQVETKVNVSPDWLVNPATNRRLKLDLLYPEIGVAVRLEGLSGKRRQRLSLEEEEQEKIRLQARAEVCRTRGIELIVVNVGHDPQAVFGTIDLALSRAKQRAAKAEVSRQIGRVRAEAANLSRRIKSERDLNLYAELWQDRLYQVPEPGQTAALANVAKVSFVEGMEVEHTIFGPGVVLAVTPSGDDTLLSVDFVTAGPKTLAVSLVGDKLTPR
ncbi:MAG: hypothetical protein JW953_14000 [Anaerolineae bacterium]|nr:hypothetical protein [Anaerolineae bacterium]